MFKVQFENPTAMLPKEGCSKRLKPASPLVLLATMIREEIKKTYTVSEDRPFHIELVHFASAKASGMVPKPLTLERAMAIEGRPVEFDKYGFGFITPKAFVMYVGNVEGYGMTHVTVAYMPNMVNQSHFQDVYDIAQSVVKQFVMDC